MKLNEKYEKTLENLENLVDATPEELQISVLIGLTLRQIFEVHQKLDQLLEEN